MEEVLRRDLKDGLPRDTCPELNVQNNRTQHATMFKIEKQHRGEVLHLKDSRPVYTIKIEK